MSVLSFVSDFGDLRAEQALALEGNLKSDEAAALHRSPSRRARCAYILARSQLKWAIGIHAHVLPSEIILGKRPGGGLTVRQPAHLAGLYVSLSHSSTFVASAFSLSAHVGIDVEVCRSSFDIDRIARIIFSSDERARLQNLSGHAEKLAFFTRLFTIREAIGKIGGAGLSAPLKALTFSVADDGVASFTDPQRGLGIFKNYFYRSCQFVRFAPLRLALTMSGSTSSPSRLLELRRCWETAVD